MNLLDIADMANREIRITYYPNQDKRFCANFEKGEVSRGVMLVGEHGNADNPIGALNDYTAKIRGKTIIFDSMSENPQKITVPEQTELIKQ